MMRLFLIFILFTGILIPCYCQNSENYFKDASTYPILINNLLGSELGTDDKKLVQNFLDAWKKNSISDSLKSEAIRYSNLLYARKARPVLYKDFIFFIIALNQNVKKIENESVLLNFMEQFIENKKNTLNTIGNFIQCMQDLYTQNYIHNSDYLKWSFSEKEFAFKILNGTFVVVFPIGKLTCYAKHDSLQIYETSGIYYPIVNKWLGNGGLVTWERAGFKRDDVNVRMVNYTLDLNKVEYTSDSVLYTNPKYFTHPVYGKLKDKVMEITNSQTASFPEFDSYSKRFKLNDLYENVDYDGGFTMKGSKIIGSGNELEDAIIKIKKGTKVLMEVRSKYFVFHPEIVNGIHSVIKITLDKDSIFHNDLDFSYFVKLKEINLNRNESYSSLSPYLDSYHRVDMDFEQLIWKIDQPKIYLTMAKGTTIGFARFESQNYFISNLSLKNYKEWML